MPFLYPSIRMLFQSPRRTVESLLHGKIAYLQENRWFGILSSSSTIERKRQLYSLGHENKTKLIGSCVLLLSLQQKGGGWRSRVIKLISFFLLPSSSSFSSPCRSLALGCTWRAGRIRSAKSFGLRAPRFLAQQRRSLVHRRSRRKHWLHKQTSSFLSW